MPRLSIVTPFPPYPPHSGGTTHIFHASRQLSRFYDLALITLAERPAAIRWGPLEAWCSELHAIERKAMSRRSALKRPAALLDPPGIRRDWSPELAKFLHTHWRRAPPDLVQLEFTNMAQYAPLARAAGAFVVCTAHNVAFLAQLRRARQERELRLRARRLIGALSLWQYELRTLKHCDLVITLSQADADALHRWLPRLPALYIPSGVDLEQSQVCFNPHAPAEVLFVGNYAHPPNVEGALWFVKAVWPLVREQHPSAHLTLAGRTPPPAIQALAGEDIGVPGALEHLEPVYTQASVVVAPIFWGSGVRLKLLEALAYGVPVVTTRLASEGIALEQGVSAIFAEKPAEFAAAVVRLLEDPSLRATLGANGRLVVERDYDWARIGRRLAGLYEGARARATPW